MRFLGFAKGVGVMKKNYEKPTFVRRERLGQVVADGSPIPV